MTMINSLRDIALDELDKHTESFIVELCKNDPYELDPTNFVNRIRSTVSINKERGVKVASDSYGIPEKIVRAILLVK